MRSFSEVLAASYRRQVTGTTGGGDRVRKRAWPLEKTRRRFQKPSSCSPRHPINLGGRRPQTLTGIGITLVAERIDSGRARHHLLL